MCYSKISHIQGGREVLRLQILCSKTKTFCKISFLIGRQQMHPKGLRRWVPCYTPWVTGFWRRKLVKKMSNWEKSDNMILNFYPSQVFFAKHIFHFDIIKGTTETDGVERKGIFLIPAAEHNFCTPFFKHSFGETVLASTTFCSAPKRHPLDVHRMGFLYLHRIF